MLAELGAQPPRDQLSCEPPGVNGQTMRTVRAASRRLGQRPRPANGNAPSAAANWRLLMPCSLVSVTLPLSMMHDRRRCA